MCGNQTILPVLLLKKCSTSPLTLGSNIIKTPLLCPVPWEMEIQGDPRNLRRPSSNKCRPLLRLNGRIRRWSSCSWPYRSQAPELNSWPCRMLPGTEFARHGPRRLWEDSGNLRRRSFTSCCPLRRRIERIPSMNQLLLAFRLLGPRAQFLAVSACSPGRHLQGMGPGDFRGTWWISGDPVLQNGVRYRDVLGASVDNPA